MLTLERVISPLTRSPLASQPALGIRTVGPRWLGHLITVPFIYSLAVPLVLLDIWVSLYQALCFPIYGIARVPRRPYMVIDRHRLRYLNLLQKAHCAYCGYATGVLSYTRAITARTERYWCPIKHAKPILDAHDLYPFFLDYNDAKGYHRLLAELRRSRKPVPPSR